MISFATSARCIKLSLNSSKTKLTCLYNSFLHLLHALILRVNPFWIELSYYLIFSLVGFLALKHLNHVVSVSAQTSNFLQCPTCPFNHSHVCWWGNFHILSGLYLMKCKSSQKQETGRRTLDCQEKLIKNCIQLLAYVVLCYLLVVQLFGFTLISIYIRTVPSAGEVLKKKGINLPTFSAFTTVSPFANFGFLPTNENTMVFKKNSGLLLILIPQILVGNTLYPPCLRLIIWILQKITKGAEFTFMLKNSRTLGYNHLLSDVHSIFLAMTVLGFMILQLLLFCILEWNSDSTAGLSAFQKLIGSLFQLANSRHAGESVFDLSLISPAMLVLFALMM
ncbi:unnamed protein product [Coffea canephora]|uniref:Uncharacterized protein n=1 Tax=Coffea canephora TaxID=49390 RepID=A0A068VAH4_COFCA|nr:unnamed protein product [Coffea canephora]